SSVLLRSCALPFTPPAPPGTYTLSLHDALPISRYSARIAGRSAGAAGRITVFGIGTPPSRKKQRAAPRPPARWARRRQRRVFACGRRRCRGKALRLVGGQTAGLLDLLDRVGEAVLLLQFFHRGFAVLNKGRGVDALAVVGLFVILHDLGQLVPALVGLGLGDLFGEVDDKFAVFGDACFHVCSLLNQFIQNI